jgi:hypothetical protein
MTRAAPRSEASLALLLPSLALIQPISVAARSARSKARPVFVRSNTGVVGSNLTRGMDVCVRLFCVNVVLCIGRGLAEG